MKATPRASACNADRFCTAVLLRQALLRCLWLLLAAGPPALVYGLTLAPSLTWAHGGADGGEFLAAARTGGIPHPPGFPTYLALATLFLHVPLGDPATRLNVLSACSAAMAAALVATAVHEVPGKKEAFRLAGLVAGWLVALSPLVWRQAVITEVYTTAAAFAGTLLVLSRRGSSLPGDLALGVLWGLGIGVHPILLLFAPLLLTHRRRIGVLLAGIALGLLPYAALPLRAAGNAPVNWGNAQTWAGWWWLVSGAPYRGYLQLHGWETLRRAGGHLALLARQLTPLGLPLALYGWTLLRLDRARAAAAEAIAAASTFLFSVLWGSVDAFLYLVPALVLFAAWSGKGLGALLLQLQRKLGGHWARALPVFAFVLPGFLLFSGWKAADLHRDCAAREFAQRVFAEAPRGAVLITRTDRHTFALWGFQYGLDAGRPDVTVVDEDLLAFSWYREGLEQGAGMTGLSAAGDPWAFLRELGRPVCAVGDSFLSCERVHEEAAISAVP